jgi:hypothetical protein
MRIAVVLRATGVRLQRQNAEEKNQRGKNNHQTLHDSPAFLKPNWEKTNIAPPIVQCLY